jgi:predicted TIM-barrel fold metal-dependent hydrolase
VSNQLQSAIGPIIDCNVHLWDQGDNPVFWLSDRTLVRDMLGDYETLPDRYTVADYRAETLHHDVRGVIWSDAGAADPMAAADWVSRQRGETPTVVAMVSLGDPTAATFGDLVAQCQRRPLMRSIRIRLVPALSASASGGDVVDDRLFLHNLRLLASAGLVATIEATASQLGTVARLAAALPHLSIVVDHFGWPAVGPAGADMAAHMDRLASLAAFGNVATRVDALGTIFGDWTVAQMRPWLLGVTDAFGPQRCMLGSDLPIERLRSGFTPLYAAYDAVFAAFSDDERSWLFHRAAEHWYGTATSADA